MRALESAVTTVATVLVLALAWTVGPLAAQTPPAIRDGRSLRIGVIGAGNMGAPIGLGLAAAGHRVMFATRNPEELVELMRQGAPRVSVGHVDAAAYFADVIVLATPPVAFQQLGTDFAGLMRGKIVIDISNPRVDREGPITNEWLARGTGEAMAEFFPGTRFVKAFNTVGPRDFTNPVRDGVRIAIPIATNDREAGEITAALARDFGLEPVIAGGLARAKEFDRGSPIWETGAGAAEVREHLRLN
jgi:predicted dinucleotide-binding enzyme